MTPSELAVLEAKAAAFDRILEILWPLEDPFADWDGSTIELVGSEVLSVYPEASQGIRILRDDLK
jgi:hypothetical protein